jgi:hypothetical protein
VESRVDNEIPHTNETLVAVGVNLVVVLNLVCDELEQFSTSEFHLLLVVLVFDYIGASSVTKTKFFIPSLLIGHRIDVFSDALAKVCIVASWIVIDGVVGSIL